MNDDLPEKQNSETNSIDIETTPNDAEDLSVDGDRVFDISGDTISLITDDAPAPIPPPLARKSVPTSVKPASAAPGFPQKPTLTIDTDNLLDEKIGSFDATPFSGSPVLVKGPRPSIPIQDINSALEKINAGSANPKAAVPGIKTSINESNPITPPVPKKNLSDAFSSLVENQKFGPNARPTPQPETDPNSAGTPAPSSLQEAILKQTQSATATQIKESLFAENGILKPLRTYEGDVAEIMSHKKTSIASMVIAENKQADGEEVISNEEPSHAGKKVFMLLLSLVLLSGGTIGAYYLYSISPLAPVSSQPVQQQAPTSIIPANTHAIVTIDSAIPYVIQQRLETEIAQPQDAHSIKDIIMVSKDATGNTTRISGPDMIQIMDINAPDILKRSLTQNWMLGVYANPEGQKSVFVVLTSNFFQNTFAGMLQWESLMADDIRQYLSSNTVRGITNTHRDTTVLATSTQATTATSSSQLISTTTIEAEVEPYSTIRGRFEDRIIKNRDVRAFKTEDGATLFLYSFINNSNLVITDKEATLVEILTRLEKQSFMR